MNKILFLVLISFFSATYSFAAKSISCSVQSIKQDTLDKNFAALLQPSKKELYGSWKVSTSTSPCSKFDLPVLTFSDSHLEEGGLQVESMMSSGTPMDTEILFQNGSANFIHMFDKGEYIPAWVACRIAKDNKNKLVCRTHQFTKKGEKTSKTPRMGYELIKSGP